MIKDIELIKSRFESNFKTYNKLALVQQHICNELNLLISTLCEGDITRAMEVGAGTGFLTSNLTKLYPNSEWYFNDLTPYSGNFISEFAEQTSHTYIWGDAEEIDFPENLDLIASASTVQWFEDIDGFLSKAHKANNRDGYIALTTFGKENFKEIESTMGEGLDYLSRSELEDLFIKNGYEIVHSNDYTKSLLFDTPLDVLRHIKATGVNSIKRERLTKSSLLEFENSYKSLFSIADGRVTLTYHPIIIIGKAHL